MSTDETYLESFIENIGTLPSEMRRNLIHMRSLDQAYGKIIQELRDCEEDYLVRAYETISTLPVQSKAEPVKKKQKIISGNEEKEGEEEGGNNNGDRDRDRDEEESSENNKDNGNNKNESKDGENMNDDEDEDEDDDDDENDGDFWTNPKEGIPISVPLSVLPEEERGIDDDDDDDKEDKSGENEDGGDNKKGPSKCKTKTILVVPTTEELRQKINSSSTFSPSSSKEALIRIATLRRDARQMAEEKLTNARQTYMLVDNAIKRLDDDLEKFEAMLKTTGQYEKAVVTGGPQPNDLAAIQVTPNSPDWILAKVITHDQRTGMYNLSDEDIESNKTFTLPETQVVILGGVDRLSRGDVIYAVYPDTTSFYQATVVQIPKKIPGKDPLVLVHFKDDGDENGITHEKPVPMKHVMRVPYGAVQ